MGKSINKADAKWLVASAASLIAGIWVIWNADFSQESIINHIKFIYSLFLAISISFAAYYIIFKLEDKKDDKKR